MITEMFRIEARSTKEVVLIGPRAFSQFKIYLAKYYSSPVPKMTHTVTKKNIV
jgi:hypothetical protein